MLKHIAKASKLLREMEFMDKQYNKINFLHTYLAMINYIKKKSNSKQI